MSYVSDCSARFVRATSMSSCVVRRLMYFCPICVVRDTQASASDQPAASAIAKAASDARRLPPKMSISHSPSSPTRCVLYAYPFCAPPAWRFFQSRLQSAPTPNFGMNAA